MGSRPYSVELGLGTSWYVVRGPMNEEVGGLMGLSAAQTRCAQLNAAYRRGVLDERARARKAARKARKR